MHESLLDRLLDPVAECFTPETAWRILHVRLDAEEQARADALADKASGGELSPQEQAEHARFVHAGDVMALLQAKARTYLKQNAAS